ncbi:MAG: Calx-beta domain-containing protein [Caldilineaceae bacterium]
MMNKRLWRTKLQRWANSRLVRTLLVGLLCATASAWFVTHAQSQDGALSPTPSAESATPGGAKIYLPLVQNSVAVQASAVLPQELPALGMVYTGLEVDTTGGCRGLWRIAKTKNCTHGPDLPPPNVNIKKETMPLAPQQTALATPGICDGDGVSGNRVQVMYVRASDKADRFSQYQSSIQQWAADMDQIYYDSAVETGGTRRIRFVHNASCAPTVLNVVLSATGDDDFSNTMNELSALGYNRSDRKYVMFMDADIYCGIGSLAGDDQPGQSNANNFGPSYARADNGCWSGFVVSHELNHNLGGVQLSAPHTSGGYHCVDEYDVMCYSDSPNYPPMQYLCPDSAHENRLDCNHDDYYNTNPAAGSYLATHWNTANSQFLIKPNLPTPTPTATATATPTPSPGCTLYSSSNVPVTIADLSTVTSNLVVGNSFTLTDVNVRNLQILHTYDSDLQVVLISPTGTQITLFTGVGGSGANFTGTNLDDGAATAISNGAAPFTGSYRPASALSALNGQNASGTWLLRITDMAGGDTGVLNAWSLELCRGTTSTPTATPTITRVPPTVTPTPTSTSTPTPVLPRLTINDMTINENAGNVVFTVSLAPASSQAVSVNYATANGSAVAGSDYTARSGTLTFNAGVTSAQITIPIINDTVVESDETFVVNLSNAVNATIADNQGSGTIKDDDSATACGQFRTQNLTADTNDALPNNTVQVAIWYDGVINASLPTLVQIEYRNPATGSLSWLTIGNASDPGGAIHRFDQRIDTREYNLGACTLTGKVQISNVTADGTIDGVALGIYSKDSSGRYRLLHSQSTTLNTISDYVDSWRVMVADAVLTARTPQVTNSSAREQVRMMIVGAKLLGNGQYTLQ